MCLVCCLYLHAAAGLCCQVSNVILLLNCPRAPNLCTRSHIHAKALLEQGCIMIAEESSPASNNAAMYGTQPRNRTHQKQRRFSGFPFTSQRPYGGVHKKLGSPRSPIARATTLPTRYYSCSGNTNVEGMQMLLAPYQVLSKIIPPTRNLCTVPLWSCVNQSLYLQ